MKIPPVNCTAPVRAHLWATGIAAENLLTSSKPQNTMTNESECTNHTKGMRVFHGLPM